MTSAITAAIISAQTSVTVPTYLGDWDTADTKSWFRVVKGVFTEVKSGNVDTVATGDIVTVGAYQGVQLDGVAEYASFAATAAYFAGITTKGTVDLVLRIDTIAANKSFACIADDEAIDDDADTFNMHSNATNKYRGRFRYLTANQKNSVANVLANGNTYHLRQSFNTTTGIQSQSVFIDDMGTAIDTDALTLDDTLVNAGTRVFTFGALSDGSANAACTVIECMVRANEHTDQLVDFAP